MPVPLGILFGPAAAWGLGIGNLVGDYFGGSWSVMSIFGFLINILIPYLSYRFFHRLMRGAENPQGLSHNRLFPVREP
ncbi:MAG TPA: QueT transporter family protein, partial [Methanoregula sp.]|nr:QueT transporter family protein [Methanoregula sp.]